MKTLGQTRLCVAVCAALLSLGSFAGCGLGLAPARNDATLALRLASLESVPSGGPESSSRAVMPGSGNLYIRTVAASGEGALYGPYAFTAGEDFVTTEIPAGTYDVYVLHSGKDLSSSSERFDILGGSFTFTELMSLPDEGFVEFVSEDVDKAALDEFLDGMVAFGEVKGVTLVPNMVNRLAVTLVPITSAGYDYDLSGSTLFTFSSSVRSRHFYRLSGITVSLPVVDGSLSLRLVDETASGTVINGLAFYSESGRRVPAARSGTSLVSGLTWTIAASDLNEIARSDGYLELYQYLDYTGQFYATYFNTAGGVKVSFNGNPTADYQGKRVLFAIYDDAAYQELLAGASWQRIDPIAKGIIPLDDATGDGSASVSASLIDGTTYYYSAQVDVGNHYASLANLATADIATLVPYRNDIVTDGPSGMVAFTAGSPITIDAASCVVYDEYVFFADSSGPGSGASPATPKSFANLMIDVNALPTGSRAMIYLVGDVTGITQAAGGMIMKDVSVRSYAADAYTISPPAALLNTAIFNVNAGFSLTLENVTIDASYATSATYNLITNLGTLKLGDGCTVNGRSVTGSGTGAGVYSTGDLEIFGATIQNCSNDTTGGAIYLDGGTCTIGYTTRILDNASGATGAAIYAPMGTSCSILSGEISGNVAGSDAVIYGYDDGTPNVTYDPVLVTFSGNLPANIVYDIP